MAHPAWFGGPKTPEQQKETLKTGLKLAFVLGAVMIVIALVVKITLLTSLKSSWTILLLRRLLNG